MKPATSDLELLRPHTLCGRLRWRAPKGRGDLPDAGPGGMATFPWSHLPGRPAAVTVLVLAALLFYPISLCGQAAVDPTDPDLQLLSPGARAVVKQAAVDLNHPTRETAGGRVDLRTGIRRAAYTPQPLSYRPSDPEQAARTYLMRDHRRFGLSPGLDELRIKRVTRSPAGHHVVFQQIAARRPVYQGIVKVNLNRALQPISTFNAIYEGIEPDAAPARGHPSVSADHARHIARENITVGQARTDSPELVVFPSDSPRLAWKVTVWPRGRPGEWVLLVDAQSGRLVYGVNAATRLHAVHRSEKTRRSSGRHAPSAHTAPSELQTDGSGLVFYPDPLTTAGVGYGGSYSDNNDQNSDALTSETYAVPLPELAERGGEYYLEGPFVRITGSNPAYYPGSGLNAVNYNPPAESNPDDFVYTRDKYGFEAVSAYFHIDNSQRYVRSLHEGFRDLPPQPVQVNPHGEGSYDNSFFYPDSNLISFGEGGVDDAEDANVIWHEYAHALLERAAPGLLNQQYCGESRAFHEGWGDYWTASHRRGLTVSLSGLTAADYDWRELFPWDSGNGTIWPGRRISHAGTYPADLEGDCYRDGGLWAAALMDIFSTLERQYGVLQARMISDTINLQSHYFLPEHASTFTFRDAARALLYADLLLYGGQHRFIFFDHLRQRGFIRPHEYGPQLSIDPTTGIDYADGQMRVEVVAAGREFPVETVLLHWRRLGEDATFHTSILEQQDDSLYTGSISVSDDPGLVEYYLDASDEAGVPQFLPASGPQQPFIARIGNVRESDLTTTLQPTGDWISVDTGFQVERTPRGTGHLLSEPLDLAENNDLKTFLVLTHGYRMGEGIGGNMKISTDEGRSWSVIEPYNEYPVARADIPPLQGEPVFSGDLATDHPIRTVFDLTDYAGRQVQLRLEFASADGTGGDPRWNVYKLTLYQATLDSSLAVTRSLALHPNYPNPFSSNTTVHFTLPSPSTVTLELYDTLGRRVRLIRHRSYDAGTHTVRVEGGGLANGIYFVRLNTPSDQLTQPIRVIR